MQVKTEHAMIKDVLSARAFFRAMNAIHGMKEWKVLDAFARNGDLTVSSYISWINSTNLECWELSPQHEHTLKTYTRDVKIGCSYQRLQSIAPDQKYDMVVIDTPQGLHKDANGMLRVEHFSFLQSAMKLVGKKCMFVLYVNKWPYDKSKEGSHGYDEYDEYDYSAWMADRTDFYGASHFTEVTALLAYTQLVEDAGLSVANMLMVPCLSDVPGKEPYAFRLGLEVTR